MSRTPRTITLTTDFGLKDHFAASMKGVMLSLNPDLNLVDITHLIPPQDIQSAAFVLGQACPLFPPHTIHLAVVDPGVGTARKAMVARAGTQIYVAPDNGILSHILAGEENTLAYEITADHYFRKPISSTFHGRDIFAPVAAWISRDIPLHTFGPVLRNPVRFEIPAPTRVRDSLIQAAILAVDHFGNLITNLRQEDIPSYGASGGQPCKILAAQREITSFRRTFGEGGAGEIFALLGSSGYIEIAMRGGSAAGELKLKPGSTIGLVLN